MSVAEINTVDMAQVLTGAYELGDMINQSAEVSDYLYWKQQVETSSEIQEGIRRLNAKKELLKRHSVLPLSSRLSRSEGSGESTREGTRIF